MDLNVDGADRPGRRDDAGRRPGPHQPRRLQPGPPRRRGGFSDLAARPGSGGRHGSTWATPTLNGVVDGDDLADVASRLSALTAPLSRRRRRRRFPNRRRAGCWLCAGARCSCRSASADIEATELVTDDDEVANTDVRSDRPDRGLTAARSTSTREEQSMRFHTSNLRAAVAGGWPLTASATAPAWAVPVMDGTSDAEYGAALSVQNTNTQFGNAHRTATRSTAAAAPRSTRSSPGSPAAGCTCWSPAIWRRTSTSWKSSSTRRRAAQRHRRRRRRHRDGANCCPAASIRFCCGGFPPPDGGNTTIAAPCSGWTA